MFGFIKNRPVHSHCTPRNNSFVDSPYATTIILRQPALITNTEGRIIHFTLQECTSEQMAHPQIHVNAKRLADNAINLCMRIPTAHMIYIVQMWQLKAHHLI